ncbi:hypothetical protein HYDPIDRAFT_24322 [Hydnomerulius pinastri MD-312]|nr:hypothetical protein HYDPIDRAFT_24322 [Hydnomerulius pinastri MD-312]
MLDSAQIRASKRRSLSQTHPHQRDVAPIPPTLVNSPHLSSPHSVFRRKSSVLKWPSRQDDDWLADMVPVDRRQRQTGYARSEGCNDKYELESSPSSTSSDSSYSDFITPPSPILRPHSSPPDVSRMAIHAPYGGPHSSRGPHD